MFKAHGKTLSAITFVCNQHNDYGCKIVTNVKSFYDSKFFNDTVYCPTIDRIMNYVNLHYKDEKLIILCDELFTFIENNGGRYSKANNKLIHFICQLRKKEITFVTTCQVWSSIDIQVRKLCRYQVACKMVKLPITKRAICINEINNGYEVKFNSDLQEHTAPRIQTNIFKCSKVIANTYDTTEVV